MNNSQLILVKNALVAFSVSEEVADEIVSDLVVDTAKAAFELKDLWDKSGLSHLSFDEFLKVLKEKEGV